MQIVIIGAGEVGFHAAKALSEGNHDITALISSQKNVLVFQKILM